jgi:pilus assembly protein CpaF
MFGGRFGCQIAVMVTDEIELTPALKNLLALPDLTDLLLIGSADTWVDVGRGLERAPNPFETDDELAAELIRLAADCGARLDIAQPLADFALGPLRLHAVMPAGVTRAPLLSVRRHPSARVLLSHLREVEMFGTETQQFFEQMLERGDNFLISGATGSGKTTLLSALLQQAAGRTICIEQTEELHPPAPGLTLVERAANIEGAGSISSGELLVHALRMRPDRVVVGEVRGAEIKSLLQAMNNGHRGSGATLHSASLAKVADRLILLGMLANTEPDLTSRLVAGAVDWVIQLERTERRRVVDIGKPLLVEGRLVVNSAWAQIHVSGQGVGTGAPH